MQAGRKIRGDVRRSRCSIDGHRKQPSFTGAGGGCSDRKAVLQLLNRSSQFLDKIWISYVEDSNVSVAETTDAYLPFARQSQRKEVAVCHVGVLISQSNEVDKAGITVTTFWNKTNDVLAFGKRGHRYRQLRYSFRLPIECNFSHLNTVELQADAMRRLGDALQCHLQQTGLWRSLIEVLD